VLPKYLVQAAADECRHTLETRNAEVPLPKRIADAIAAFAKIGIDRSRIEAKLGATSNFTAVDLANLQISYKSIVRNEIGAEDEFPRIEGAAPAGSKLDMLEDALDAGESAEVEVDTGEATDAADEQADQAEAGISPAEQTLANIRESIAGCTTAAELATCDKAWLKHRAAYDDEVAKGIDAEIAAKRKALAGGSTDGGEG
jgi:hypothetical protein